ncbi:hypothetical protein V5O48_016356 [Marasmius crinis-equi]|uniref:Uncharacterized protein n=1 Tax=Marasmius crinis-equi TaxID=585013 RepID=A0ABR3ERZ4_9AGAR
MSETPTRPPSASVLRLRAVFAKDSPGPAQASPAIISQTPPPGGNIPPPFPEPIQSVDDIAELNFDQIEASFGGARPPSTAVITAPEQSFTVEDGRELKRFKALSPDSEREYDEFVKNLYKGPADAFSRIMLVQLENRDLLRQSTAENKSKWSISNCPNLAKTLRDMAHIAILSPNIYGYKAKELKNVVIKTMRLIGTEDLPAEQERGRIAECLRTVTKQLTSSRYDIKLALGRSLIDESGKPRSKPVDIGTLVYSLIGESGAPPLAALHFRVAWLRSVWLDLFQKQKQSIDQGAGAADQPQEEANNAETQAASASGLKRGRTAKNKSKKLNQLKEEVDFWGIVDSELRSLREEFNTPELLGRAFKAAYDQDVEAYGKSGTDLETGGDVGEWLKSIHRATADKRISAAGDEDE